MVTSRIARITGSGWLIFFIVILVHGAITLGRPLSSPDTALYDQLTKEMLSGDYSETFTTAALRWSKSVVLGVMAGVRLLFPEHWKLVMIGLNVLCSGVTGVLVVWVLRGATRSPIAPMVGLCLYLCSYDTIIWVRHVLTDTMYTTLSFLCFALLARGLHTPHDRRIHLLLAGLLVLTTFSRPQGAIVALLVIVAEIGFIHAGPRRRRAVLVASMCLFAAGIALRTYLFHDLSRWPFDFARPKVEAIVELEKEGQVVNHRPETYHRPPTTLSAHFMMSADRTLRFFQFASTAYSRSHNLFNIAYFVPAYALSFIAIVFALRGRTDGGHLPRLAAVWIVAFAVFHGLTILDYDWRFRAPLLPHLAVLAGCGASAIGERITAWRAARPQLRPESPALR